MLVGLRRSGEPAEAAKSRKHTTRLAAPLEVQPQTTPTPPGRQEAANQKPALRWGGVSSRRSAAKPRPNPRGFARTSAVRSRRGRREQVGPAEVGRACWRGLAGPSRGQGSAAVGSGPRGQRRGGGGQRAETSSFSLVSGVRSPEDAPLYK